MCDSYAVLDGRQFLPHLQQLSLEGHNGLKMVPQLLTSVLLLQPVSHSHSSETQSPVPITYAMTSSKAWPRERGLPPSWLTCSWWERWDTESRRRLNSSSTVLSLSFGTISPAAQTQCRAVRGGGVCVGGGGGALTSGEVQRASAVDLGHLQSQLLLQHAKRVASQPCDHHGTQICHIGSTLESVDTTSNAILKRAHLYIHNAN